MDQPGEFELLVGVADITDCRWITVREAHMAVDGGSLFRRLLHQENGFGAMAAEMIFFFHTKNRNFLPFPVDFLIPLFHLIEIDLAQIMEEGGNGQGFLRGRLWEQKGQLLRILVDVNGMLAEAAAIRAMILRAGRSGDSGDSGSKLLCRLRQLAARSRVLLSAPCRLDRHGFDQMGDPRKVEPVS